MSNDTNPTTILVDSFGIADTITDVLEYKWHPVREETLALVRTVDWELRARQCWIPVGELAVATA